MQKWWFSIPKTCSLLEIVKKYHKNYFFGKIYNFIIDVNSITAIVCMWVNNSRYVQKLVVDVCVIHARLWKMSVQNYESKIVWFPPLSTNLGWLFVKSLLSVCISRTMVFNIDLVVWIIVSVVLWYNANIK